MSHRIITMASVDSSHWDTRVHSPSSSLLRSPPPLHDGQRTGLPRGCRFRDLSEAHRNITGRSISASSVMNGSVFGSDSVAGPDNLFYNAGRQLSSDITAKISDKISERDPFSSPASPYVEDVDDESDEPEYVGIKKPVVNTSIKSSSPMPISTPELTTKSRQLSPLHSDDISPLSTASSDKELHEICSSGSKPRTTRDSNDTTVGRLYKQYEAHILNAEHGSSNYPTPEATQVGVPRDGATNRLGYHNDEDRFSTPSRSPTVNRLLNANTPRPQSENSNKRRGNANPASPQSFSFLLTVPTRESLLYPKPLRVQSIRAEAKHMSFRSGIAVSATGMTTESDDDPFRYDKDPYKIFLHPSKERDISAALNHISGLNSHSQATLYRQEESLVARKLSLPPPPILKEYLENESFVSGPTRVRSPTPDSADGFYDTSVIQPNWAAESSAYEVKVVLQDVNPNRNINVECSSKTNKASRISSSTPFRNSIFYHGRDKENAITSECDEWETVATSGAGFGSLRLPLPVRAVVGLGSEGVKITGSSVADVSDGSSFYNMPFDEYASTDRIVQHPSGHEDSEESLQIRNVSGKKIPIILPKQRLHRVNGFAQDASRAFPHHPVGGEAAAILARNVSGPSRQPARGLSRRFSPMPLHTLPARLENTNSRFQPQNGAQAPARGVSGPTSAYEFKGTTSSETEKTRNKNGITISEDVSGTGEETLSMRDSGSSQSSGGTVHSFPFPLIPLPEAARLQAVKRAKEADMNANLYWHGKDADRQRSSFQPRCRPRAPATLFSSVFAPNSTQSSYRNSRPKKRRTLPRDLTLQSAFSSTAAGGTWATILPFGSTSTRSAGPSQVLKTAPSWLHFDELGRKFQQRRNQSFAIGSGSLIRSYTPRLYPWDYQARQRQKMQETDPELRAIALSESQNALCGSVHDIERTGVPLDPEAFISREGRRRRRTWFYSMLAVSMFPFISILVYVGTFNSGLSWYTQGEVDRLNARQQRIIFALMVLQFVFWPLVVGLVIWRGQN